MEDFNNYENEVFNTLPEKIIGCNFKNCVFNADSTLERCNLENCVINNNLYFLLSNIADCEILAKGCTFESSNIICSDDEEQLIDDEDVVDEKLDA